MASHLLTEDACPARIAKAMAKLGPLTLNQPTNAELEEALNDLVPEIKAALSTWLSSRHILAAQARNEAQARERHPELAAVMDCLTRRTPSIPGPVAMNPHQFMSDLVSPFVQRRRLA